MANSLKDALGLYATSGGQGKPALDVEAALDFMNEKLNVVRGMLHGFDYSDFMDGTPTERVSLIVNAQEFLLAKRDQDRVKDRFIREVLQLGKAYALSVPHPEALAVREEYRLPADGARGAQQARRHQHGPGAARRQAAVQRLVETRWPRTDDRRLAPRAEEAEPLDSVPEALEDIRGMPQKNLAVECSTSCCRRRAARGGGACSRGLSEKLEAAIGATRTAALRRRR